MTQLHVIKTKMMNHGRYLTFPKLEKEANLIHAFSTRCGGVSQAPFGSLNFGFGRGDEDNLVKRNYQLLAEDIGFDENDYVLTDQVHQAVIRQVTREDRGKGLWRPSDIKATDGLVTDCRGVTLTTFYADCTPLYFYEPVKGVIGMAHAGWRGTVRKIGQRMLERMQQSYNCRLADIRVGIGPSIGRDCYEVGQDVKKEFEKEWGCGILEKIFQPMTTRGKYRLDLKQANAYILVQCGLLPEHLMVAEHCTFAEKDCFFSHRRMGAARGSHIGIMALC